MPTALFISPHLDDVAFSCGGLLANMARRGGWRAILITAFTKSVPNPRGFALECQLDKGFGPGVDYMKLRRGEDREFAGRAGLREPPVWLDLPEAPHRGYESAAELFSTVRGDDAVREALSEEMERLENSLDPEYVFLPQALGGHVDHSQVLRAALPAFAPEKTLFYRDCPYAVKDPDAKPSNLLPSGLREKAFDISGTMETKVRACSAYASQLGFQFGGEGKMRDALTDFAAAEARRLGSGFGVAEAFSLFEGNALASE